MAATTTDYPQLDEDAAALRADGELKGYLRARWNLRAVGAALLRRLAHGIHLCTESTTFVIDHEFAHDPWVSTSARLWPTFSWRISRRMGTTPAARAIGC